MFLEGNKHRKRVSLPPDLHGAGIYHVHHTHVLFWTLEGPPKHGVCWTWEMLVRALIASKIICFVWIVMNNTKCERMMLFVNECLCYENCHSSSTNWQAKNRVLHRWMARMAGECALTDRHIVCFFRLVAHSEGGRMRQDLLKPNKCVENCWLKRLGAKLHQLRFI